MTTLRWDEIHAMQNAGVAWCDEACFAEICELAKLEAARQEREFDRTGAIRAFVEAAIPLPQGDGSGEDSGDPFFPVV